jgi:hypothetical protein
MHVVIPAVTLPSRAIAAKFRAISPLGVLRLRAVIVYIRG